ncbi:MAG: hypothetical protein OEW02_13675, partial [Myxococcales bacterium]|nr:hypothetical protein [Myxococcales bacterium]
PSKKQLPPLAPRIRFAARLVRSASIAAALVGSALALGAAGYRNFEGLSWLDATLNAAMILTGMGPVTNLVTVEGKLFAIFYCLFSGVVFLTLVAVLFAPVAHRFLHRFHIELGDENEKP